MEQNATRVGRQARQHYPEPDDDGTECQKTRETSPENQKEPENDDGTECQKARETSPEPYPEPKNQDGTKMVSWKN